MRQHLIIAALFVAVAGAARPASAAITSGCCACLSVPHAETSQAPPVVQPALACSLLTCVGSQYSGSQVNR